MQMNETGAATKWQKKSLTENLLVGTPTHTDHHVQVVGIHPLVSISNVHPVLMRYMIRSAFYWDAACEIPTWCPQLVGDNTRRQRVQLKQFKITRRRCCPLSAKVLFFWLKNKISWVVHHPLKSEHVFMTPSSGGHHSRLWFASALSLSQLIVSLSPRHQNRRLVYYLCILFSTALFCHRRGAPSESWTLQLKN